MNIQTLYRPLAFLSIISIVLASTLTTVSVSAETSALEVPPGQLTRRAVSGTIASISPFAVTTRFGDVVIDVTGSTVIRAGGEESDGLLPEHVGAKVGVLLDKSPDAQEKSGGDDDDDGDTVDLSVPSDGEDTGTEPDLTPTQTPDETPVDPDLTSPTPVDETPVDPSNDTGTEVDLTVPADIPDTSTEPDTKPAPIKSFRQPVTALRISIVPLKASRKHECVVVTATGDGTTTVLDDEGNETELEGEAGAEGEDICLITRGYKGGGKKITGSVDPGSVDDRLVRLAERNAALAEKLEQKKADREAKRDERLERTANNAPADKKGAADGAREKNANRGKGGGGSSGSGGSGGGGSSGGGNSGNSGGGGGNSGNSGGGGGNSGGGNSGGGNN